jgi:hypothetical protein
MPKIYADLLMIISLITMGDNGFGTKGTVNKQGEYSFKLYCIRVK